MFFVAISVCPLNYHNENNIIYSYGIAANIVYALTFLMVILWFVIIIKIEKNYLIESIILYMDFLYLVQL